MAYYDGDGKYLGEDWTNVQLKKAHEATEKRFKDLEERVKKLENIIEFYTKEDDDLDIPWNNGDFYKD